MSLVNLDLVETALALTEQASAEEDYRLAEDCANLALSAARRTKNGALEREMTTMLNEVKRARQGFSDVQAALTKLTEDPDDREANATVGRWYCLAKGEWEKGLPHLAKSPEQTLADLASQDLEAPVDPPEQRSLAEEWIELAESEDGPGKLQMYLRARHWLEQALPALSGADQVSASDRLGEIAAKVPPQLSKVEGVIEPGNVALAANGAMVVGGARADELIDGVIPPTLRGLGIAVDAWPCQWTVTLPKVYTLREIRLALPVGESFFNYTISTSVDGRHFVPLTDRRQGRWLGVQQIRFLSRPVQAIRLQGTHHSGNRSFYASELEAYCIPPAGP